MTKVYTKPDNSKSFLARDLVDLVYPVGSIYMSVNATNPSSLFGGTWEAWGTGRVPVGINGNDSNFDTVEKTGGVATVTLTADQSGLPAHAHTLSNHTHTAGAHTHSLNNHTHTAGAHTHGLNSHTHTISSHSHGLNGHTHSFSATTGSAGAHSHWIDAKEAKSEASGYGLTVTNGFKDRVLITGAKRWSDTNGAHTHSVSGTTGGNSGSTAGSGNLTSGGPSQANTASGGNVATGGPSTANTGSGGNVATGGPSTANTSTTTAAGASSAHTNLQPYITCYMWKRTA